MTLLVGLSPLMHYTARVSNTGPLLSACFGATVLGLLRPEGAAGGVGGAVGIVLGGATKYAPAVAVPVVVAMRRWRTLGWTLGLAAAVAGGTVGVTGPGVWAEYGRVIWPPLQKSSDSEACQSAWGFLARVTHQFPLGDRAVLGIKVAQDVVGVAVLALLVRRRAFWDVPAHAAAAAAALMAWLLVFAPVAWQFYHCMLTPLRGRSSIG